MIVKNSNGTASIIKVIEVTNPEYKLISAKEFMDYNSKPFIRCLEEYIKSKEEDVKNAEINVINDDGIIYTRNGMVSTYSFKKIRNANQILRDLKAGNFCRCAENFRIIFIAISCISGYMSFKYGRTATIEWLRAHI